MFRSNPARSGVSPGPSLGPHRQTPPQNLSMGVTLIILD